MNENVTVVAIATAVFLLRVARAAGVAVIQIRSVCWHIVCAPAAEFLSYSDGISAVLTMVVAPAIGHVLVGGMVGTDILQGADVEIEACR